MGFSVSDNICFGNCIESLFKQCNGTMYILVIVGGSWNAFAFLISFCTEGMDDCGHKLWKTVSIILLWSQKLHLY